MEKYSKEYYTTLNYFNYLERQDKYVKTSEELIVLLEQLNLITKKSFILDYGCATGMLLKGFSQNGFNMLAGYDISTWAVAEARKNGHNIIENLELAKNADVFIALDVFEHMEDEEIKQAINTVKPKTILARIPSSIDGGKTFHLEVSKLDKTHINCKDKASWIDFFAEMNYLALRINLCSIYDSAGVTCLLLIAK